MNCATRLAALLEGWTIPNQATAFDTRGGDGNDVGLTTWRAVTAGVVLVSEVDRALAGLRACNVDVADWERLLPEWYGAIYSRDHTWRTTTHGQALEPTAMTMLRMLGLYLDRAAEEPTIAQTDRDALSALFDEVVELLNTTTEIPEPQKIQLYGLTVAARRTLGSLDVVGSDALRAQVSELALTIGSAVSEVTDEQTQSKMRRIMVALWTPFAGVGTGVAIGVLTPEVTKLIALTGH